MAKRPGGGIAITSPPRYGRKTDPHKGWRLPARPVEDIIITGIINLLKDPVRVLRLMGDETMTSRQLNYVAKACAVKPVTSRRLSPSRPWNCGFSKKA
jgi:hypothetical protein